MSNQPPCPECEKLSAVAEKSNEIGEFLDWINDELGYKICEFFESNEKDQSPTGYYPIYGGFENLLAKYYGIDLQKVEQERRLLLEWLRNKDKE